MKRVLPLLLGPIVLLTAAVPAGAAQDSTHGGRSALADYRLAVSDAKKQTSVLWTLQYMGNFHELLTTTDGTQSGSQAMLVTNNGQTGFANEVLLPSGTAYVKGTSLGLRDGVGLSSASATNAANAGSWYAFTRSTTGYAQVADGLTVASSAKDLTYSVSATQRHMSFCPPTVVNGLAVVPIEHIATDLYGTETLYVTATGTHPLPVELKIPKLHETYSYTWGGSVTAPTAPTASAKPGASLKFAAS